MLKWLVKKWSKEGTEDALKRLNFHLSSSFMNVKKDMDVLSRDISKNSDQFKFLDQRLTFLETQFMTFFSQLQKNPQQKQEKTEELMSPATSNKTFKPEMVLSELTYTQKNLLVTLYEYQIKLESPISIKSLAKILYPDKELSQVRTTITEYLEVLSSYNLISKTRKRRQTYAQVTEFGEGLMTQLIGKPKKKQKSS